MNVQKLVLDRLKMMQFMIKLIYQFSTDMGNSTISTKKNSKTRLEDVEKLDFGKTKNYISINLYNNQTNQQKA